MSRPYTPKGRLARNAKAEGASRRFAQVAGGAVVVPPTVEVNELLDYHTELDDFLPPRPSPTAIWTEDGWVEPRVVEATAVPFRARLLLPGGKD